MASEIQFRRNFVRRQKERRVNPYAFNSPEWIAMMRESYELWPRVDRRFRERRSSERRHFERRSQRRNPSGAKQLRRDIGIAREDILADDEKQMIMDLFRDQL